MIFSRLEDKAQYIGEKWWEMLPMIKILVKLQVWCVLNKISSAFSLFNIIKWRNKRQEISKSPPVWLPWRSSASLACKWGPGIKTPIKIISLSKISQQLKPHPRKTSSWELQFITKKGIRGLGSFSKGTSPIPLTLICPWWKLLSPLKNLIQKATICRREQLILWTILSIKSN